MAQTHQLRSLLQLRLELTHCSETLRILLQTIRKCGVSLPAAAKQTPPRDLLLSFRIPRYGQLDLRLLDETRKFELLARRQTRENQITGIPTTSDLQADVDERPSLLEAAYSRVEIQVQLRNATEKERPGNVQSKALTPRARRPLTDESKRSTRATLRAHQRFLSSADPTGMGKSCFSCLETCKKART